MILFCNAFGDWGRGRSISFEYSQISGLLSIIVLCLLILGPGRLEGQIRSGGSFLKILPGARSQGMSASLTGSIDEMYAIYANPGAVGFLREWQWSTSYTEWIADVYNLSFIYGKRIGTPWSRATRMAIGLQYQGVREFNSTNRPDAVASASDLLLNLSLGNPLSIVSRNLSLGTNLKYFRSALGDLSASTWLVDLGLLYRFPRFSIKSSLVDYGHVSTGISISHLGPALKFIADETPLPRTFRAGAAINLGAHDGLQVQLAADYRKVRDEKGGLGFGTEVSWGYRVALRSGYNFNENFLSKFSFGLSFRLDDQATPVGNVLPGRNNAMRVDVAGLEKNEFFSTSFLGAANLYPIGPEKIEFVEQYLEEQTQSKMMTLSWTLSQDPDLFDEVRYLLLISQSLESHDGFEKLGEVIDQIEQNSKDLFTILDKNRSSLFTILDSGFEVDDQRREMSFASDTFAEGDYFWSVVAYDRDHHVRFAERNGERIRRFRILPVLEITEVEFDYDKWIDESDYQGELHITVQNKGKTKAQDDFLTVKDYLVPGQFNAVSSKSAWNHAHTDRALAETEGAARVGKVSLNGLRAGQDTTVILKWHTPHQGAHRVEAQIVRGHKVSANGNSNNTASEIFYTIPKGTFLAPEKAVAAVDTVYDYELPFISKIFFDKHSSEVEVRKTSLMYSPLETLVNRLAKRKNVKLQLRGHVDATIGESEALIIERAEAVREEFLKLGVPDSLLEIPSDISPEQINHHPNRTSEPDWKWVEQERRYVKITAHEMQSDDEEVVDLFHSVTLTLPKSRTLLPIPFASNIEGFVPLRTGWVEIHSGSRKTRLQNIHYTKNYPDTVLWHHYSDAGDKWLFKKTGYEVVMEDSLGRTFYTKERTAVFKPEKYNLLPDKIIVGVSDFTRDTPSHNLYWSRVINRISERLETNPNLSLQFVGHACEIGTHSVNDSLSLNRARKFQNQFLAEVERQTPELLGRIDARLEMCEGRGKKEPFNFEIEKGNFLFVIKNKSEQEYQHLSNLIESGKKSIKFYPFILRVENDRIRLISDNSTTFGRQINRRIEIIIRKLPGTEFSTY